MIAILPSAVRDRRFTSSRSCARTGTPTLLRGSVGGDRTVVKCR